MSAPDPKRTLGIFDHVDLAAIERASISGHGIFEPRPDFEGGDQTYARGFYSSCGDTHA